MLVKQAPVEELVRLSQLAEAFPGQQTPATSDR